MSPENGMIDAFGRALMAYDREGEAKYVIERGDGLREILSAGEYFKEYDEWPRYERESIVEARGRALDVGCGAGRAALWLQKRGLEVVSIDNSPLALRVAALRGVKNCRLMDVRKLEFPAAYFDTIIMFDNNFGIAGDVEQTRRVLRSLHRITTEKGIIVATSRDPLKTDNPAHLAYHERNRHRGRPPGLVTIRIGYQDEFNDWFDLLMIGEEEMWKIIEPTGWILERLYGSEIDNYAVILRKRSRYY